MIAESEGIVQESPQISEVMMPVLTVVMMLFMFKCLCKYSGYTDSLLFMLLIASGL